MEAYIRTGKRRVFRYRINPGRFSAFLATVLALFLLTYVLLSWDSLFYRQYSLSEFDSRVLEEYFTAEQDQGVPWYYLAAVDRAEEIPPEGISRERSSAVALHLRGIQKPDEIRELLKTYKDDSRFLKKVVQEVKKFKNLKAIYENKVFPIAPGYEYDYENGYGEGRSFGGERKHEGIDIMCAKGVPLVSVCDGVIEKKGWNTLGGWRLGIRGEDGIYYYYAHLSMYNDKLQEGDPVVKGQVIGFAGDSGYGEEGTIGQFEPHLHFGMYEGKDMKPVNPYPFLKVWERKTFEELTK